MFQYTREVIINDQVFEKRENTDKGVVELFIPNVGNYRKENIANVIHNAAVVGTLAELAIPTTATTTVSASVIRFTVKIRMQAGAVDAILANYTTLFTRGIVVEVKAGATAAAIKTAFREGMKGMEEWPVRYDDASGKIVAKLPHVALSLLTEELVDRPNSISEMTVGASSTSAEVAGVLPFGTYDYLITSHRLITVENTHPWSEAQPEYPQKGYTYDLFDIFYRAKRNIGGFDVLGQEATSLTTHRFWVRSDRKAAFMAALAGVTGVALTSLEDEVETPDGE